MDMTGYEITLFNEVRKLEKEALGKKAILKEDIKTSSEMRKDAWKMYLENRIEYLKTQLGISRNYQGENIYG